MSDQSTIYHWDFILSSGDTIKEKSEALFRTISLFCLRKNNTNSHPVVYMNSTSASYIEVWASDYLVEPAPYEEVEDGILVGTFKRSCGDNGYQTIFDLIKSDTYPDEVRIVSDGQEEIIKLHNMMDSPSVGLQAFDKEKIIGKNNTVFWLGAILLAIVISWFARKNYEEDSTDPVPNWMQHHEKMHIKIELDGKNVVDEEVDLQFKSTK